MTYNYLKTGESCIYPNLKEVHKWGFWRYVKALDYIQKDYTVMDLGCGCGYGSHILSHKADEVIAIDNRDEVIRFAKKYHNKPNINYKFKDVFLLNEKVDLVVAFEVIEHIKNTKKVLKLISELTDRLILTVPHITCPKISKYHYRHFSKTDIDKLLRNIGFVIMDYDKIRFGNGNAVFCYAERSIR